MNNNCSAFLEIDSIMSKKNLFLVLIALVIMGCQSSPKKPQPNLVIILVDDMGWADVGFNGCKDIPTPNIDEIAK